MSSASTSWRFLETRSFPSKNAWGSKLTARSLVDNKSTNSTNSPLIIFFTNFPGMGAWPGPTTNALSNDAAKLSPCEEKLVTCDTNIGAAIDQAWRAKQEPGVEEMARNIHIKGCNLNLPATEESELAATMAKLQTTLETGGRAALGSRAVRFSTQNTTTKVGKDCWSAWATATAILLGREFEVPKATVETAMESPDDGGADMEGAGKRSARGSRSGHTEKLGNTDKRANTHGLGNNIRRQQKVSKSKEKTLNGSRKNTKTQFRTIEGKKAVKWRRKTLKNSKNWRRPNHYTQ